MVAPEPEIYPYELRPRSAPHCCSAAARFATWSDRLLAQLTGEDGESNDPSLIALNRAELALLRQFWRERCGAAPEHRNAVSGVDGAPCVYGVFLTAYERLQDVALRVDPPPLAAPPPRATPEVLPLQAMGLLLGES